MADYTNNYKYIAEAWIENGEEEGFKTAFLASLFLQWQGHSDDEQNPKFNADMVDGKHYQDITDDIRDAVADTIKGFYIGYTHFDADNIEGTQYNIGTEGVHLYPNSLYTNMNDIEFDSYIETLVFPWNSNEEYEINQLTEEENPNIYDIIKELYYQLDAKKLDTSTFESFQREQEDINDLVDDINETLNSFHVTEDGVDASSVNGLRFFVITQEEYEGLDPDVRKNIHNIFIIKEQEDITNYYESIGESGVYRYKQNPDVAPWNRAYMFKIDVLQEGGEKYLMYKLTTDGDDSWQPIAPTNDFVDVGFLQSLMEQNMPEGSRQNFINLNYTLNPNNNADYNEIVDFPITNVYDKRYISGAYFPTFSYNSNNDSISQGTKREVPITVTDNGLQFLDFAENDNSNINVLNTLKDALNNRINSINTKLGTLTSLVGTKNDLASADTVFGKIKQNQANISTNTNSIAALKGGETTMTVKGAETQINSLEQRILQLESDIIDKEKFDMLVFNKYDNTKVAGGSLFGFKGAGSVFFRRQGMCFVYFYMYATTDFKYKTVGGTPDYIQITSSPLPKKYRPIGGPTDAFFIPTVSWNSGMIGVIKINPRTGHIAYANTVENQKTNKFNILASYSYPCQGDNGYGGNVDSDSCYDLPSGATKPTEQQINDMWG